MKATPSITGVAEIVLNVNGPTAFTTKVGDVPTKINVTPASALFSVQQSQQFILRMDRLIADDAKDLLVPPQYVAMRMIIHRNEFLCIRRRMSTM